MDYALNSSCYLMSLTGHFAVSSGEVVIIILICLEFYFSCICNASSLGTSLGDVPLLALIGCHYSYWYGILVIWNHSALNGVFRYTTFH